MYTYVEFLAACLSFRWEIGETATDCEVASPGSSVRFGQGVSFSFKQSRTKRRRKMLVDGSFTNSAYRYTCTNDYVFSEGDESPFLVVYKSLID
jgi:hypothetical protein